jgi:hypothetical protein
VVGHQAIGPAGDAEATARLGEPVLIESVLIETKIFQLEEYPPASIAALGDVMRRTSASFSSVDNKCGNLISRLLLAKPCH